MTIKERLELLIKELGLNPTSLSKRLNLSQTSIQKNIEGKSLPSSKILIPLGEKLGVSIDWLLFGKGTMFLPDVDNQSLIEINEAIIKYKVSPSIDPNRKVPIHDIDFLIEVLRGQLEDKDRIIEEKEKRIGEKDKLIEEKDKRIQILESQKSK